MMLLKNLQKGCGIFVVVFAVFAFFYNVMFSMLAQRNYLRAGVADTSFFLSLLASACMSVAAMMLWSVFHIGKDLRALKDSAWRLSFKDNEKAFLCGRIYPLNHLAVKSPFTQKDCVAYEYEILSFHGKQQAKHYWGVHLIPSAIRTMRGEHRVLSRPQLQGFEKMVLKDSFSQQNAAAYLATANVEAIGLGAELPGGIKEMIKEYVNEYEERDAVVQVDKKLSVASEVNAASEMRETRVEVGEEVCLSGLWLSEKQTVVADLSRNVLLTLYRGGAVEVKSHLVKRAVTNSLVAVLLGAGINLFILFFGRVSKMMME